MMQDNEALPTGDTPVPCNCGCGALAKVGKKFINGHSERGKKQSREHAEKIFLTKKIFPTGIPKHTRTCVCGCNGSFECKLTSLQKYIHGHNTRNTPVATILKRTLTRHKLHPLWHSEATIEKIRKANLGKKRSNEVKEKLSVLHTGKKYSVETKEKIRIITKRRHADPSDYFNSPQCRIDGRLHAIKQRSEGKFPATDTLPHRLLREGMQTHSLWDGFVNEYPFKWGCIDIANSEKKVAIYVDGDYWHCNPLKYPNGPIYKVQKNTIHYDKIHNSYLKHNGWVVLRFWEYDIKNRLNECLDKIKDAVIFSEDTVSILKKLQTKRASSKEFEEVTVGFHNNGKE